MRETLTDAVEALNGARAAEAAEPPDAELARTVRVLDVHLSAFKWLDEQAGGLDEDLRRVDALMADEHSSGIAYSTVITEYPCTYSAVIRRIPLYSL